jgi:DNA-binding MarR family transcriptional regulator
MGCMAPQLQEVGLAVKRLQWRHHREANTRLATIGLSLVQWDVLRHLHREPDASLHALAQLTFQTDQSMGSLATRMIGRGLLRRLEGPGRAVRHEVTEAGEQARVAGAGLVDEIMTATVGRLTETERATLLALLTKATGKP